MSPEELKENEDKLKQVESDLKKEAQTLDKEKERLTNWEKDLSKREEDLTKKLGLGSSAEAFENVTKLITNLYTTYVGTRGNDEGLSETIQSILDARKKLS